MAQRHSNTLPVIVWFLGLLGCTGYIDLLYPFGFIPVIIPLIFWFLGSKFTKMHCRVYFNVLLTAFIIHVIGVVIFEVLNFVGIHIINLMYLGLVYFAIFCIFGLLSALNNRKYNPELVVHVF